MKPGIRAAVCVILLYCCWAVDLADAGAVLVLGSGGNIGSHLVTWLQEHGYDVAEVKSRTHIDLRQEGALDSFDPNEIDFVFFLACEVGGSKFIASGDISYQQQIVQNNLAIYNVVFPWLQEHQMPFVFTSSYLQMQPNAYGTIKRLGEQYVEAIGLGRSVRLWNIYGAEKIGVKSHVVSDWVVQCLRDKHVQSRTDGREERQFLHVDDCAAALGVMMQNYDALEPVTDVSSSLWVSLWTIGQRIAELGDCTISFNPDVQSSLRFRHNPRAFPHDWEPSISLDAGVQLMFDHYRAELAPLKQEL